MPEDFKRDSCLWSRISHNKTRARAEALPEVNLPRSTPHDLRTPSLYDESALHSLAISECGDSIRGSGKTSLKVKVKNLRRNCVKTFRPRSAPGHEGRFDLSQVPGSNASSRYEPSHTTVESSRYSTTVEQPEFIQGPFSRGKKIEDQLSQSETSMDEVRSESSKAKTDASGDECKEISEEDQMEETIRALRSTAIKITSHRKLPHCEVASSINSLPSLQLSPNESANSTGDTSACAHSIYKKAFATPWPDGHTRNKNNLRISIRLEEFSPEESPCSESTNPGATFSPSDFEDGPDRQHDEEDDDSICTLSDGEPDYFSIPFSLPTWPALPTCLHGPFAR